MCVCVSMSNKFSNLNPRHEANQSRRITRCHNNRIGTNFKACASRTLPRRTESVLKTNGL